LISSEAQTLHTFFETEHYFDKHYINLSTLYYDTDSKSKSITEIITSVLLCGGSRAKQFAKSIENIREKKTKEYLDYLAQT